ncbi:rhamnogalacturonan acetylesterase [Streptomyces pathocidini]|uniref:rhamnogalacturonan acetylesterase n=1 Tax=Streptomyces pathocidini TaxID=1650571 RepID=UPI0033F061E2
MTTVHIAGDSTASRKRAADAPETGWGMALPLFLHRDLAVANHAVNSRSSRSFIAEGRLAAILGAAAPSDVLLVQFGHNDQKTEDPSRCTEPWTTYQSFLRRYVAEARAHGLRPVLLTPVERRGFDPGGRAVDTHGEYPAAMRALAEEQAVPLLDIHALTLALWEKLGAEETKRYFHWTETERDDTHFNPPGAIAIARLVATELLAKGVLSPREVRRLDAEIPGSRITWPEA